MPLDPSDMLVKKASGAVSATWTCVHLAPPIRLWRKFGQLVANSAATASDVVAVVVVEAPAPPDGVSIFFSGGGGALSAITLIQCTTVMM